MNLPEAKNLIAFYVENEKLVYTNAVSNVDPKEFILYANSLFKKRFGISINTYLEGQHRGATYDFLFGFLLGASAQQLIKEKV